MAESQQQTMDDGEQFEEEQFEEDDGQNQEVVEEAPAPQQQPQQETRKTANSAVSDGNVRAQKARKMADGSQQPIDVVSGLPKEMKRLEDIDMQVFLDVKQQYDIYSNFMDNSGLPFSKIPLELKTTLRKLENQLEVLKQPALQQLKVLEEKNLMSPSMASHWRCALEDPMGPAKAQDNVVGFVACANRYHDSEKRELRDQNTKLQEELKAKNDEMARLQAMKQQRQQAATGRATVPSQPTRQTNAPQQQRVQKNGKVNLLGMSEGVTTRTVTLQETKARQPAASVRNNWAQQQQDDHDSDAPDYNVTPEVASLANFFGGLFNSSMADSC